MSVHASPQGSNRVAAASPPTGALQPACLTRVDLHDGALRLHVCLPAHPNIESSNTLELSGELSVGDVIEILHGEHTHWLACDPYGWRPITKPERRTGQPLTAAVYQHLATQRAR